MSSETGKSGAGNRPRLATIWLGGCSGCHMSFLDLDERLFALESIADIVFSPFLDQKEFPEDVDVVLVEGAVANEDNRELLLKARDRSRILVAFGDCAVNGNVTAMRNPIGSGLSVIEDCYRRGEPEPTCLPLERPVVPALFDRVVPVHRLVKVDGYIPGCPPSADLIFEATRELLAGQLPDLTGRYRFG